MTRIVLIIGI